MLSWWFHPIMAYYGLCIKKRKKVAKKEKKYCRMVMDSGAKNFVDCHKKSHKVTDLMEIWYIKYKNYPFFTEKKDNIYIL